MLTIRKAGLKDIPEIAELWTEFMGHHDKLVLKANKKLKPYIAKIKNAEKRYKKFLKQNFKSRKGAVFIAEADGTVAGYNLIFVKDEIPIFKIKKVGYFSDLYIRKKFRGLRVSSRLRDEAIKWFKKKGIKHLSIGVYCDNEFARSVYKRWGFFDYKVEMRRQI